MKDRPALTRLRDESVQRFAGYTTRKELDKRLRAFVLLVFPNKNVPLSNKCTVLSQEMRKAFGPARLRMDWGLHHAAARPRELISFPGVPAKHGSVSVKLTQGSGTASSLRTRELSSSRCCMRCRMPVYHHSQATCSRTPSRSKEFVGLLMQ